MNDRKNKHLRVNRSICFILCLWCLPAFFTVEAQTVYSLEQCKQMALEHHAKVKNARNNVAGAEETKKEAFTRYFPEVSASGLGYNANKGLLNMSLGPDMGMSMLKNGLLGSVTAMQPVFAGGQIVHGNQLAKLSIDVERLQLKLSENEVTLDAEKYYWQLITLKEKRATLLSMRSMLDQLYHDVDVAVNAGTTPRNDLLRVKLQRNEVESLLLNVDNNISLSKLVLAQYIGQEGKDIDCVSTVSLEELPSAPTNLRQDHRSALNQTAEYRLLEKNVENQTLQKKLLVGKHLPTVGVGVGYVYQNLMDKDMNAGMVLASVSIPISSWWGGSHAIKKQKLEIQNAANEQADQGDLLVIRMQKAWNDVENAYKQLGIANNSIEQSTENLRLNNDYYKAGVTKMGDLLDAQSLYQKSRDEYVDAYADYELKKVEYLQAIGQ